MKYPKGIKAIYDNGGKTFDRYTVYYSSYSFWANDPQEKTRFYDCVGMSDRPFHPQGYGQHSYGQIGRHNGKRIAFEDLPIDCQELVKQDLGVNL